MPRLVRDGYDIYYRFDGNPEGPLLILSHSLGANLRMWEPQVEALGSKFHLLRYDHPGHGRSGSTSQDDRSDRASSAPLHDGAGVRLPRELSISDLGRDVTALLDHLGVEKAFFCGLSLGGMVGIWLGAHAGNRIRKLAISSSSARIERPELLLKRIESIRQTGIASISDNVVEKWLSADFRNRRPETAAWVREMLLETRSEGYAVLAETVSRLDLREDLQTVRCPCLVMYGEFDQATPPAWNIAIHERIRGSKLVPLAAAHLANIEDADEFSAGLRQFFGCVTKNV